MNPVYAGFSSLSRVARDRWNRLPLLLQCLIVLATTLFPLNAFAGQRVSLEWDANTDGVTTGYFIYTRSIAGNLLSRTDVGPMTTTTVTGLLEGSTCVFSVTAYAINGIESAPSNQVSYLVPDPDPATPDPEASNPPPADPPPADPLPTPEVLPIDPPSVATDEGGEGLETYVVLARPRVGLQSGTTSALIYKVASQSGEGFHAYPLTSGNLALFIDTSASSVQTVSTSEAQPVNIFLSGVDLKGDAPTYSIASTPTHGFLSGSAPNLTYSPAAGYHGTDSFTFKVSDGKATSATTTVSITVQRTNQAPIAGSLLLSAEEDVAVSLTLTGSDSDGDALTFAVVTSPTKGKLTGTVPNLVYTPAANVTGIDSFTFNVRDGKASSSPASVTINIAPVNDAPLASAESITTTEDQPVGITLSSSDIEGDALAYSIVTAPEKGSLSGTAPDLVYTPAANATGTDSFTYAASDSSSTSVPATVSITITPVNDAPVANPLNISTFQEQTSYFALNASDIDGDNLTYSIVRAPLHGTLGGTAPDLTYIPDAGYFGRDSFICKVSDGLLNSADATVSITVHRLNKAPVAGSLNVTALQAQFASLTLSGSDPDDDAISFAIVTAPAHGVLTGTAPNLTYGPTTGYSGGDSFTFTANDGTQSSEIATVSIKIMPINGALAATTQTVTTSGYQPVNILLDALDLEGEALTYTIITPPARGTLSGVAPELVYTPKTNVSGSDTLLILASNDSSSSVSITVEINITAVNTVPVAQGRTVTSYGNPVAFNLTASDADSDPLDCGIVTWPAIGSLEKISDLSFHYIPPAGFTGVTTFTYTAGDGEATSEPATVTIRVIAVGALERERSAGILPRLRYFTPGTLNP